MAGAAECFAALLELGTNEGVAAGLGSRLTADVTSCSCAVSMAAQ